MKLPGAERAVVDLEKVRDYLVSSTHPVGRFKARFFEKLGYSSENWERLRDALLEAARVGSATSGQPSPYGEKFEVRATLAGPANRADVVLVWIVLIGEDFPRFVTAFPA